MGVGQRLLSLAELRKLQPLPSHKGMTVSL
jgi:hypothetical protein